MPDPSDLEQILRNASRERLRAFAPALQEAMQRFAIAANLQRSGLFRPLDPASFIEKDLTAAVQPRFPDWKQINAQAPDDAAKVSFNDLIVKPAALALRSLRPRSASPSVRCLPP